MAAYAALVSLMNTIDNTHNHPLHSFSLDKKQIQSLHKIIGFLLDFIESYNNTRGASIEEEVLESQIASAARAAEDVIESHVVDQILAGSTTDLGETSSASLLDLERVLKAMNSVMEKVMQFKETKEFKDWQPSYSMPAASVSKPLITTENVMVGFDDELNRLMDRLTGYQSDLQIVPIVGMGGIGKTTLTQNVYENLLVVQHFDIRAWVTISQEYTVKSIISELLACIIDREMDAESEDQLGIKLYQTLSGRRYLIVLDDIWSIEVWFTIRFYFPDNDSRSRVVITTRISNVATYLSSSSFEMNFLDEDKSWKLLCVKTFQQESCPPELEEIGKKISRDCKGLPLSISVIGGLLRNSRKREYWESVARDLNAILMLEKDEHCLNVLSLSYNHLPAHLKPCFLYMGVFPEDHNIHVSRLIKLFAAEGFLKTSNVQSLEEVAHDYLMDLLGRYLILACSWSWNRTIKFCKMHDLVREVCIRIAEKEKFFNMMRVLDIPPGRIVFCSDTTLKEDQRQAYDADRLSLRGRRFKSILNPSRVKVLKVLPRVGFESLESIFQQVNLRYLTYEPSKSSNPEFLLSKLHSSVSQLWNMQTLIIRGSTGRIDAPSEIWSMRQLRHLQFNEIFLPEPPPSDEGDQQDDLLLPNLQTLSKVVDFSFTEETCKRIPKVKKLRLRYNDFSGECHEKCHYYVINLGSLHKLQSLSCSFDQVPNRADLLQSLVFPSFLKKLRLHNCLLHWEDMNTFGLSLPHLEVLKLGDRSVVGLEWHAVEGGFPRLKYLKISCQDLQKWTAENSDFPVLEKLHLQYLSRLEKIPSGFGETLKDLQVYWCNVSAAISSTEILEEQLSLGNDDLQVGITFMLKHGEDTLKEEVEIESFTSKNFEYEVSFIPEAFVPIKSPFQGFVSMNIYNHL